MTNESQQLSTGNMAGFENFEQLVASRRSMRAFMPEPVPEDVLTRIFRTAQQAPSNCNTQPWVVHVVSGEILEGLRKALPEAFNAGKISLDFPYDGDYQGVYRERQQASAQALYSAAGIDRKDEGARTEQFMQNFRFFDAPHVAFLFLPDHFGLREAADVGMYAQTLMLAIAAEGLGSCPQTSLGFLSEPIREVLEVERGLKLMFGISFGYPDQQASINRCQTEREELARSVQFRQ